MFAVRNIRLCSKDCLCLYICPTGATDTENSIIDVKKCIGCGACARSCPSGAITMAPEKYPAQQRKDETVTQALFSVAESKAKQVMMARTIAGKEKDPIARQVAEMAGLSTKLQAEDLLREAGFMLPQSRNTHELLEEWVKKPPFADFPVETAKKLLAMIPCND